MIAFLLGVAASLASCDRSTGNGTASDADSLRIVSFVPATTRVLIDLGLDDALVGVAEHDVAAACIGSAEPLPVVGNYLDIDYERLLTLSPTHVVFPDTTHGVPERLRSLEAASEFELHVEPYPVTLSDVYGLVASAGSAFDRIDRANSLNLRMRQVLRRSTDQPGTDAPRSVLLVFAVDPVVASGPGSVNDELIHLAGGRNAVGDAAVSAVTLDREALIAAAPDVVVLLLPGARDAEAEKKVAWFDAMPLPAVASGRVVAITDPEVLLPSTNLPGVLETLAAVVSGAMAKDAQAGPVIRSTEGFAGREAGETLP